jgi:hypothetical protein
VTGVTSNLNYLYFFAFFATLVLPRGHYVRTLWINQMFAKVHGDALFTTMPAKTKAHLLSQEMGYLILIYMDIYYLAHTVTPLTTRLLSGVP